MSLENSLAVLTRLRNILLFSFPVVLFLLFLITRMIAARSIRPISTITYTADNITRNNLNERITLPKNRDELFSLTNSINHLLDRLEQALNREKQFTSDASHELRTPLTVLKGTLEVLVRKPRTQTEYEEKVGEAIQEIDRMSRTVEQLLTLARVDNMPRLDAIRPIGLQSLLEDILARYTRPLSEKNMQVRIQASGPDSVLGDPHLIDLLLDNLLSNAVKYSAENGEIDLKIMHESEQITLLIRDDGIGIRTEDLEKIYTPFFRSGALDHKQISGNGLGLAIVKKISDLLELKVHISSEVGEGTQVRLHFPAA